MSADSFTLRNIEGLGRWRIALRDPKRTDRIYECHQDPSLVWVLLASNFSSKRYFRSFAGGLIGKVTPVARHARGLPWVSARGVTSMRGDLQGGHRRGGKGLVLILLIAAVWLLFGSPGAAFGVEEGVDEGVQGAVEEPVEQGGADAEDGFADALEDEPDPLFDDDDDFFDDEFSAGPAGYPDPLESTNRGVFAFNRQVDRWILDPITRAYRWAVPKPARNAISNFFLNLGSTKTLVNDALQLEWVDASVTTGRLVINTTVGIAGLFDVASRIGLERHESDFGQTLALAGTPSGPYIMLPVLGPSNVRDGFGTVVDGFFQPTYYILGPSELFFGGASEILIYSGSSGISTRDQRFLELKALEESSVDFYAAMRSGFYQDRVGQVWGRRVGHRTTQEPSFGADSAETDAADDR